MSYLALSSIVALLIKLSLFWVAKGALFKDNQPLAFFLIALCALNIAELMLFIHMDNEHYLLGILQSYYAAGVIAAASLFYLGIHVTQRKVYYAAISFAASILIAILTFIPDVILSGFQSIGYSVTRIPGEYFPVLQVYLIGTLVMSVALLLYGALKSADRMVNKRSLVLLISVVPLVFFTITITVTLSLGIKINGTVILSMMTSLMLVILIYCEKHYRLFKFLSYVPYTHEYELRTRAGKLVDKMIQDLFDSGSSVNLKDIRAQFETALIQLAIESTGGNKTHAAKLLGIGKATLHRKIEGLQI
jgi:DNA-binding protein Fis